MDKTNLLKKLYYDEKSPAGYSSALKLYKFAKQKIPTLKLDEVKDFLKSQITYTLHRQARRKFKRNPVVVSHQHEQWQADLMDMKEWSRQNNGYNYILTVIDIFSKVGFAVPIKTKHGELVAEAFKTIFKSVTPGAIQTDKGKEFLNKHVQDLLKEHNIQYFTSQNEAIKCAVVERFNSTLKNKIFKIATKKGTRKWLDVLPDVIRTYNKTYHRSLKMAPKDVNENNRDEVFKNLYGFDSYRDYLKANSRDKQHLPVGSKVRKVYPKGRFDRGYYPYFTDSIHEVTGVSKKNPRTTYKLDNDQRDYYAQEIQQVDDSPLYRIEKVLRERLVNNRKQKLVKFIGYEKPEWIYASDIEQV